MKAAHMRGFLIHHHHVKTNYMHVDKLFVATKAFITNSKGEVLLLRESSQYEDGTNAGKLDAVGGRVNPGERFDESLLREIQEETGIEVELGRPFHVGEWRPNVRGEQWQIIATFFECKALSDKVSLSDDHKEALWVNPKDYHKYSNELIGSIEQAFESYLAR